MDPTACRDVLPALAIPEIVDAIFSLSMIEALPKAALVCRQWHAISLPQIWRELNSLLPLLERFCPMVYGDEGWDFDWTASTSDWEKFYSRASLVQTLKHNEEKKEGDSDSLISPQAVAQLNYCASAEAQRFLLPNVRFVWWTARSENTVMQLLAFVSSEMEKLHISLRGPEMHRSAPRMLFLLGDRVSAARLRTLKLKTQYSTDDGIQDAVAQCLEKHSGLTNVYFWFIYVSPKLARHLYGLEDLTLVEVGFHTGEPRAVRDFFESLASSCPLLRSIGLDAAPKRSHEDLPRLPWDAIAPLLICCNFVTLVIRHPKAILVSSNDIAEMGKAWPKLTVLILGGNATGEVEGVGTPFNLLTDFATAFPMLEKLAVHFSYDHQLPAADVVRTTFTKLKALSIGTSRVPESKVNAVAEYILATCPPPVELACYGKSSLRVFDTTTWLDDPERRTWRKVKDMMDVGNRVRSQWHSPAASSRALD